MPGPTPRSSCDRGAAASGAGRCVRRASGERARISFWNASMPASSRRGSRERSGHDEGADGDEPDGHHEEPDGVHLGHLRRDVRGVDQLVARRAPRHRPRSTTPASRSGTDAFSESMPKRAAAKASGRWGDDTATTTEESVSSSRPDAVEHGHPPGHGPALAELDGDGLQPGPDLLLVGLVLEVGHALATLGMVSHRAAEQHHGAAARQHTPLVGGGDRERLGGEPEPVIALRRGDHG